MPAHSHKFTLTDAEGRQRCRCGAYEAHCEVCAKRLGRPTVDSLGRVTDYHLAVPQFCSPEHQREYDRKRGQGQPTFRDFFGL